MFNCRPKLKAVCLLLAYPAAGIFETVTVDQALGVKDEYSSFNQQSLNMEKFNLRLSLLLLVLLTAALQLHSQELYEMPPSSQTKWVSFENRSGAKAAGGKENNGAKGHAFDKLPAGETVTLMNLNGSGTIRRIWMTFNDRSATMLRALRIEMFWEGESKPAVSAPLGDFFGVALGQRMPFENALFSDPEGRSFNCIIPMPFRKAAKITLSNDSDKDLQALFYDVDVLMEDHPTTMLYFHTYWSRQLKTALGKDFEVLPQVKGKGRFLGMNVGVQGDTAYGETWFGEGEVKMYIDGDREFPTLVGTGTEDYIGTAYGQGVYNHYYQGSLIADAKKGAYAWYRFHIPDPVYFRNDFKVTLQQIGGAPKAEVLAMLDRAVSLIPISIHNDDGFTKLMERPQPVNLRDPALPDGWTNFYRQDDLCATAYFYLDAPASKLPALVPVAQRIQATGKKD